MASIDKIYGDRDKWMEFHRWVATSKRPQYCRYFYPTPRDGVGPITNTTVRVDQWLWLNCPLPWVKDRLKEMYNGSPLKRSRP